MAGRPGCTGRGLRPCGFCGRAEQDRRESSARSQLSGGKNPAAFRQEAADRRGPVCERDGVMPSGVRVCPVPAQGRRFRAVTGCPPAAGAPAAGPDEV